WPIGTPLGPHVCWQRTMPATASEGGSTGSKKYYSHTQPTQTLTLIAVLVPWLSSFLPAKSLVGFVCLILQITLIGWLPAAIWAVASHVDGKNKKRIRRLERNMHRPTI